VILWLKKHSKLDSTSFSCCWRTELGISWPFGF